MTSLTLGSRGISTNPASKKVAAGAGKPFVIPFQPRQSRQRLSPARLWGQADGQLQNKAPANSPRAAFQQQHIPAPAAKAVGVNPRPSANCAVLDKGHRDRTARPGCSRPWMSCARVRGALDTHLPAARVSAAPWGTPRRR